MTRRLRLQRHLSGLAALVVAASAGCASSGHPSSLVEIDDPHQQFPPEAPPSPDGLSVTATAPGMLHRAYEPCPVPSAEADTDDPKPSVELGAMAMLGSDVAGSTRPYAAVRCR